VFPILWRLFLVDVDEFWLMLMHTRITCQFPGAALRALVCCWTRCCMAREWFDMSATVWAYSTKVRKDALPSRPDAPALTVHWPHGLMPLNSHPESIHTEETIHRRNGTQLVQLRLDTACIKVGCIRINDGRIKWLGLAASWPSGLLFVAGFA
jgi:hypothetical protein